MTFDRLVSPMLVGYSAALMTALSEPDEGKLHVRFDEGAVGWNLPEDGTVPWTNAGVHCSTLLLDGQEIDWSLDTDGDGLLDFNTPGTFISTFGSSSPDLNTSGFYSYAINYQNPPTTDKQGASIMEADWYYTGTAHYMPVMTPDNRSIYIVNLAGYLHIFIPIDATHYAEFIEGGNYDTSRTIPIVDANWAYDNQIAKHQVTIDWRPATADDSDGDGIPNTKEITSPTSSMMDRDFDDDGVIDGMDLNWDPYAGTPGWDSDEDGLPDGLEMGIQIPVPSCTDLGISGTNTNGLFHWYYNGVDVVDVKKYIADLDPLTRTDPNKADTDGDGISDAIEDADIAGLDQNHELGANDLNGRFDGGKETNPLDKDSDDDGLVDGAEDSNHDGLVGAQESDPRVFDTDGDGLGDGLECGITLKDITSDTDTSKFIPDTDPSTTTHPYAKDSDGDGIGDGWTDGFKYDSTSGNFVPFGVPDGQFQFGEGEDKNLNGKVDSGETNPMSKDSDGDHLADGWDLTTQYSGVIYWDGSKSWGELSYSAHDLDTGAGQVWQSGPTDPTSTDSDGDGMVDGNVEINGIPCELSYTHPNVIQTINGQVTHNGINQGTLFTDPSLMDTDGDQLSDGMEVMGWEVHIISEKTKLEVKSRAVFSNPTIQHTDGDATGVNDYNKFLNSADPSPGMTDTDGDLILDKNEGQGELTQIEGKDPEIQKLDSAGHRFSLTIQKSCDPDNPISCTANVNVYAMIADNSGLNWYSVRISGQDTKKIFLSGAPLESPVSVDFTCDWSKVLFSGWDVNITVADMNGNGNYTQTHVNGLVEGVIKAIIAAWNSFVEAVKKLVSEAFEWIYKAFEHLFSPIKNQIDNIGRNFMNKLINLLDELIIPNIINSGRAPVGYLIRFYNALMDIIMIIITIVTILCLLITAGENLAKSTGVLAIVIPIFVGIVSGVVCGVLGNTFNPDNAFKSQSSEPTSQEWEGWATNWENVAAIIAFIGLLIDISFLVHNGVCMQQAAVAIAMISIFIQIFSNLVDTNRPNGWLIVGIIDLISIFFGLLAVEIDLKGPFNKICKAASKIYEGLSTIVSWVALVGACIGLGADMMTISTQTG